MSFVPAEIDTGPPGEMKSPVQLRPERGPSRALFGRPLHIDLLLNSECQASVFDLHSLRNPRQELGDCLWATLPSTTDRIGQRRIFLGNVACHDCRQASVPPLASAATQGNREPMYERGCRRFPLSLGS